MTCMNGLQLERLRTFTIANWQPDTDDDDDDDDRFFESFDRMSPLSDLDDCRISFASAVSPSTARFHHTDLYDVWMSAPGSITERRNRLLQGMGMGLTAAKPLLSNTSNCVPRAALLLVDSSPGATSRVSPAMHSRSDEDIDSFSLAKQRKAEMLDAPMTRRSYSAPHHPRRLVGPTSSSSMSAFFLIKNLDTGKELVVNEYGKDGAWNRLSDLRTGKQLTMEEFEKCVGFSPVVKELMRRESVSRIGAVVRGGGGGSVHRKGVGLSANSYLYKSLRTSKRRGVALLKSGIKGMSQSVSGLISDNGNNTAGEANTNKTPTASSNTSSRWIKARQSGKAQKELSALHLCQEIQAHEGSIWTMKFSTDARYLGSAGEDRVVRVWEVQECQVMLPEMERKEYVQVPERMFALSEKPVCSLRGHLDDVLDLSWSRSRPRLVLSSSMDKTVRLWDTESKGCLKLFAHNDYVTCIQFNPMNDDFFVSGSLDGKVRIWSVPDGQVVDWTHFHEMVTAACYTPDGLRAFIGSHKGNIRIYTAHDCKLCQTAQVDIQNKKKKSRAKKITGFQFSPTNPNELLVTSADSRVRILDGQNLVHKFKGFRNTGSQIAASYSQDGKYVISASEDSQVYLWKHPHSSKRNTKSFEQFQCKDVSVAIPWPVGARGDSKRSSCGSPCSKANQSPQGSVESDASSSHYDDSPSPTHSWSWFDNARSHALHNAAWGLVVVTASLGGQIRAYQNFGLPRKVRRQTSLFGGPT